MKKYIFIGGGGFIGAILRFFIEGIHIYNYKENIPLNTLIINITGSFLLALILTIAFDVLEIDANIRLGIATGLLGAFTTFSTMCKETTRLIINGDYFSAISYITISTLLGLSAAYFGIVVAREVVAKLIKRTDAEQEVLVDSEIKSEVD